MHMKRWLALLLIAAVLLASGCTAARQDQLYLYGEFHANDELLQRELALWKDYYAGGMRDLFVELPYYTAQYLNRWMQADNDRILMEVYTDWKGSASYHQNVLDFYRGIKTACPETVFHGTDVGHQYNSTGYRYLKLLRSEGKRDTEEYRLASENIDQGLEFYRTQDGEFRENAMTQNLLREYRALGGGTVMGIYGAYHTSMTSDDGVQTMASRLTEALGDSVIFYDLREK